jgi:hypothetical protein
LGEQHLLAKTRARWPSEQRKATDAGGAGTNGH